MLPRSGPERPSESRGSRLGHALLVGLCLAAIALTLYATRDQGTSGERLQRVHDAWSAHLERLGQMSQLALAISAPCNEVFDSDQLDAELTRSRHARAECMAEMDSARIELSRRRPRVSSYHLADLQGVRKAIGDMVVDVDRAFASYGVGPPPEVIVIDEHMAVVNGGLDRLAHHARDAQAFETRRLLDSALIFQRVTSAILALISVLVIVLVVRILRSPARPESTSPDDPTPAPPIAKDSPARWLRLALPIGVCLSALAFSLYATHRQALMGDTIMASNQAWSERMARYGRLGQLPPAISAPSNEVFDSGDRDHESARSRQAREAFSAEMDSARLDVARLGAVASGPVLESLDAVEKATADLIVDVDRTFESYGVGRPPDIAVIDGHLAHINVDLGALGRRARTSQALESRKLLSSSAFYRWLTSSFFLLAAMLAGVVVLRPRRWLPRRATAAEGEAAAPVRAEAEVPAPVRARAEVAVAVAAAAGPVPAAVSRGAAPEPREAAQKTAKTAKARGDAPMPAALLAAPDPVITVDGSGRIVAWNARAARAFGRPLEAVRGTSFWETLLAPAHREAIERVMERFLEDGDEGDLNRRFEIAALDHEGREFPVELAIVPDRAGEALVFNLFMRDISRRRRIEAALRESEARTRAVIVDATDGIITFDDAGTITTANPASERIFGYRPGELIGRRVHALMSDLAAGAGRDAADRPGGHPWAIGGGGRELIGRRRDGSVFPVEISISETQGDGLLRWTGIVRDLTQRKQAQALRAGQDRVLELVASGAPLEQALAELIQLVEAQLTGAVGMVMTLDADPTRLSVCASPSLPEDFRSAAADIEIGPAGCSWGAAVHSRERVIANDTASHPSWARSRQLALYFGLRSCWAEPILSASGRALGVFAVFRRRVHTPDEFEVELVSSAARMASLAIEHAVAHNSLATSGLEAEIARTHEGFNALRLS